jgi:hypothetical protein
MRIGTWATCLSLALVSMSTAVAQAECPGGEQSIPAGIPDDYAPPVEPTDPSPQYVAYMEGVWPHGVTRPFDERTYGLALIHSFRGWEGPVCGAHLEIALEAGQYSETSNDSVRLSLVGGEDPYYSFRYWSTIANLIGVWPDDWQPGDAVTLDLDLEDLPATTHGWPTDILGDLADGELELAVEDDSAVDYAILYVCHCPVPRESSTWGQVKATYR